MSAERLASSFVRYPFGKLIPNNRDITQFLTLKRRNWAENWQCAINEKDYQSVLALAMILNEWRQSELFYQVKKEDIKIHGKQNYAMLIGQVFSLISSNRQSNHQMDLILVELLQFYYTKFRNFNEFLHFGEYIDEMIQMAERFVIFYCGSQEKEEKVEQMFDLAEGKVIRECLANLIDFLAEYDDKKKKDPGPGQKASDPSEESRQEAGYVVHHLIETSCMPHFLSTILYVKMHFLRFFDTLYQQEFSKFRETSKVDRQQKLEKRMQKIEQPRNFSQHITAEQLDPLHEHALEAEMESPFRFIRHIYDLSKKTGTKPKLFFAYINPVMRFLPLLLLSCSSGEERIFVFERLFLPIIEHLTKMYEENKKQHSFFVKYKQVSLFTHFDLVAAFRENSLLNDLEVALVGYFEQYIKQHKQVEEYTDQYMEIQSYFQLLTNLKKKVVKGLKHLKETFQQEQPFLSLSENMKSANHQNQGENRNQQTELESQSTRTITTKHKRLNAALNGSKPSESPSNMTHKKSNEKSTAFKMNKLMNVMPNIPEQSDDDDNTDAGDQINDLKETKSPPKKQIKPKKSKKQQKLKSNEIFENEDSEQSLKLEPLQMKKRSISISSEQSNQSLPKIKKNSKTSQQLLPEQSKKENTGTSAQTLPQYFSKRPLIIRQKQYLGYIQHQSNPFNSLKIFRQQVAKYKVPTDNQLQRFYFRIIHRYPILINSAFYFNSFRCLIQTHYETAKLTKKNISCQDSTRHKKLIKEIFSETQRLEMRLKSFNQMKNKNQLTKSQIEGEKQNCKKIQKDIELKKLQSSEIYCRKLKMPLNIAEIQINLFPLTTSDYGEDTLQALAKCIQEFFFHLTIKEQQIDQSKINKFNTRLFSNKKMIEIDVDYENIRENLELFLAILFETLHIMKESVNFESLKFFYENFYQRLQTHMKSIVVYYMYEIQSTKQFEFQKLFNVFFEDYLKSQDLIDVMNFFIRDSNLISIEMEYMYQQLIGVMTKSCHKMVSSVQELLCEQIVPRVKFNQRENSEQRSNFRKQKHQHLETLKEKFYVKFGELIDLMNLWGSLAFCSTENEADIPSEKIQPPQKMPFVYFCKNCGGLQPVNFSIRNEANYQSYLCVNCSNSVLHRFEISSSDINFITGRQVGNMKYLVELSTNRLKAVLKKYQWKVKPMPYLKYKLDYELGVSNIMEVEEDQNFSQRQENLSQRKQHSSRGQSSRNQSPANNRSNEGSSNKNRYREIVQKSKLPEKSIEEEIEEDNQEFCFNSLSMLVSYYTHMRHFFKESHLE